MWSTRCARFVPGNERCTDFESSLSSIRADFKSCLWDGMSSVAHQGRATVSSGVCLYFVSCMLGGCCSYWCFKLNGRVFFNCQIEFGMGHPLNVASRCGVLGDARARVSLVAWHSTGFLCCGVFLERLWLLAGYVGFTFFLERGCFFRRILQVLVRRGSW